MADVGQNINNVEQFLASYFTDVFSFLNLGDIVILPKKDSETKEFMGLLLSETAVNDLDGSILTYNVVIRLGAYRETLFDDRNGIMEIHRGLDTAIEDYLELSPVDSIFDVERSEQISYQLDDDFYDIVFAISIKV